MSQQITHFTSDKGFELYCLDFNCHTAGLEASTSDAHDYDDYDCNGSYLECHSCGEYVFPEAAAEQDAEMAHAMAQARRDAPIYRAERLAQMQAADPVAFYLNCKDNPDAIEATL